MVIEKSAVRNLDPNKGTKKRPKSYRGHYERGINNGREA
jgi:hypothetical protein